MEVKDVAVCVCVSLTDSCIRSPPPITETNSSRHLSPTWSVVLGAFLLIEGVPGLQELGGVGPPDTVQAERTRPIEFKPKAAEAGAQRGGGAWGRHLLIEPDETSSLVLLLLLQAAQLPGTTAVQ